MITPELLDRFSAEFTKDLYMVREYRNLSMGKYCAVGFLAHLYLEEHTSSKSYMCVCRYIEEELNGLRDSGSPSISFVNDKQGYDAVMELIAKIRHLGEQTE